jgi:hypothetical protein
MEKHISNGVVALTHIEGDRAQNLVKHWGVTAPTEPASNPIKIRFYAYPCATALYPHEHGYVHVDTWPRLIIDKFDVKFETA